MEEAITLLRRMRENIKNERWQTPDAQTGALLVLWLAIEKLEQHKEG